MFLLAPAKAVLIDELMQSFHTSCSLVRLRPHLPISGGETKLGITGVLTVCSRNLFTATSVVVMPKQLIVRPKRPKAPLALRLLSHEYRFLRPLQLRRLPLG